MKNREPMGLNGAFSMRKKVKGERWRITNKSLKEAAVRNPKTGNDTYFFKQNGNWIEVPPFTTARPANKNDQEKLDSLFPKKSTTRYRKIGKAAYRSATPFKTKKQAIDDAKMRRERGYSVRVQKTTDGYRAFWAFPYPKNGSQRLKTAWNKENRKILMQLKKKK